MSKIIIRSNVNPNEVNYKVRYKSSLNNKWATIIMNKEEMEYIKTNYKYSKIEEVILNGK